MEMLREGLLTLLEILWKLSVQGSFCIVLVLLIRQLLRKAPRWCSYVLWSVVFLRLICPVFPEGSFSLMPRQLQMNTKHVLEQENAWEGSLDGIVAVEDVVIDYTGIDVGKGMFLPEKMGKQVVGGNLVERQDILPSTQLPKDNKEAILVGIAIIWLLGAIGLAGYHVMSYQLLKRRMRMAVEKEEGIYEVQGEHLSFVMGIIKPRIYLSTGLDAQMRNVILCHERVHLQRKDYIFKPLALGICCVHWWNPLVWLAFYLMNKDCEMSCDEKVVALLGEESKTVYSYALLNEATNGDWFRNRRDSVCALLSFGEDHVKNRITHVLRYKKASVGVICCAVIVVVVLGVGLCLNPKEAEVSEDVADSENEEKLEKLWEQETAIQEELEMLDEFGNTDEFGERALALEKYIWAFADRDGDALFELAADKVAFLQWDMVYPQVDGTYAFGESSPWVRDWTILVGEEDSNMAKIRFIMENSVPEYYIAEETVKFTPSGDGYYVDHVDYKLYSEINSVLEMEDAYAWTNGEAIKGIYYNEEYVKLILKHLADGTNPEYYSAYQNPYTAAKTMLHLGEDKPELGMNRYAKTVSPQNSSDSTYGEGTVCNVEYYFVDGSKAVIPMVLVEESMGIWMPVMEEYDIVQTDADRSLKQGDMREIYDSCEVGDVTYQLTNMGIYQLDSNGVTFLYPAYASSNAKLAYDNGRLYFPTDSHYSSGALDWWDDSIAVFDIKTLMMGYIKLSQSAHSVFPLGGFYVQDGYINMWKEDGSQSYCMLLEDVLPVYNGKLITEFGEDDKNAYGKAVSEQIRQGSGKIYSVGLHSSLTTFAYLDLNHDDQVEEVRMTKHGIGWEEPMDSFILTVGDEKWNCTGMNQVNEIYAWSPYGDEILFLLYEEGPSGDPMTTFYRYADGTLEKVGVIENDVRRAKISEGVITTAIRKDVIQTDGIKVQYRYTKDGIIERLEQDTYEFTMGNDVELKKNIKLYDEPNGLAENQIEMKAQTVKFMKTDKNFEWVLIEANDGTMGWIRVKDILYVGDDEVMSDELFEGLCFAG